AARGSGEALQAIHQLQPADRLGACGLLDADETPCLSCMDVVDLGEHAAGRSPLAAWTRSQMSQLVVAWGDALFCVRLPWLLAVAHSLGEEGVEDAEPLETASVEVLEEAAPTHGLLLEERPMSGNQAVLLSPDGTCRLVKVAAGSGAELPGTGTASRPELRSGWAPCPKVQELARGMKPGSPAPPVPSASSSDTEGGGSAGKLSTGMKLLEEVERLRTTHVKYAHEAHAVLPVRVEQLWEEQVRQAEKEEELRDRAAKVEERNKAFAERIDRSIKLQENLQQRIAICAELERMRPRRLTTAEQGMYDELEGHKNGLQGMKRDLAMAGSRADRLVAATAEAHTRFAPKQTLMSAEQSARIEESLRRILQALADNKEKVETLTDRLERRPEASCNALVVVDP
ncbi:hypothetical protein CYMTET_33051, partial [Cymbomonas tetramitiformis]